MKWFNNFRNAKYVLIAVAAVIALASLLVSNLIVDDLKEEEERRMEVWASAMSSLISADVDEDVSLEEEILSSSLSMQCLHPPRRRRPGWRGPPSGCGCPFSAPAYAP